MWQCRIAPSLGKLEGSVEDAWRVRTYPQIDNTNCLFFGLYGLPDFYTLWRRKGRKCILWAGSDIKHFSDGYWLDETGKIRIEPEALARWINENCESYVENGVEHEALMTFGIESKIIPSFLGKIEDYFILATKLIGERPRVYLSVSGDNFDMYGWTLIEEIADRCEVDFHLYGNTKPWQTRHSNVFVHGRVSKEKMNEEIKYMDCGLRPLEFDGFSEILAKSVLWGQHPISRIGYPHIDSYKTNEELIDLLNNLKNKTEPNLKAREYYKKHLNDYPWNENNRKS